MSEREYDCEDAAEAWQADTFRKRITALTAENEELRARVREQEARLSVMHALWHQDMPAVEEVVKRLAENVRLARAALSAREGAGGGG